ncbi:MAG: PHP domain-containing protein [Gemmatimonadaceae bacterium]|nr:PHP domain-containing protein [Gemmatimonadaceae bacterium]
MTSVAPSARVDLHLHTTASDGILPPEELVQAAHAAGLAAIAVTDHDTLEGVEAAKAAATPLGIRVIPGVELSVFHDGREIHMLALHISRPEAINVRLRRFRETRQLRAEEIVRKLNALGVPLPLESVMLQAGDAAVGRPHVARAMVSHGMVRDNHEAFDRYLGFGRQAYVAKERVTAQDAIEIAHEAGGVAFWAHPGNSGKRAELEKLRDLGMDGVEVRHPSHSSEDILRLSTLVDFLQMLPSGGSDWHGTRDGPRQIGNMNVPIEWLERQDERVASRAASGVAK